MSRERKDVGNNSSSLAGENASYDLFDNWDYITPQ
jgi:hypothetical protein